MPNVNCLEGMACPKCGSEGPVIIQCTAGFLVYDDGTEFHYESGGPDWNDSSDCFCRACDYEGTVADFRKERVERCSQ